MLTTVALAGAVFVGALAQRVTGLGFALVAAPLLVVAAGPFQGVLLANLLSLVISAALLALSWRHVDVRKGVTLTISGVLGVVPGAVAARLLAPGPLQVAIGLLVVAGLLAAVGTAGSRSPRDPSIAVTGLAGACSGMMAGAAGVGGPALTVYAVRIDWERRAFAATAQLCFAVQGGAALAAKGLPSLAPTRLALVVGALLVGLAAGQWAGPRVSDTTARRAVVLLALLGGAATAVKGALAW